jgi:hypothetical protein
MIALRVLTGSLFVVPLLFGLFLPFWRAFGAGVAWNIFVGVMLLRSIHIHEWSVEQVGNATGGLLAAIGEALIMSLVGHGIRRLVMLFRRGSPAP